MLLKYNTETEINDTQIIVRSSIGIDILTQVIDRVGKSDDQAFSEVAAVNTDHLKTAHSRTLEF